MIRGISIALVAFIAVASCAPSPVKKPAMSLILEANKPIADKDIIFGDIKRHRDRQNALMAKAVRWPNKIMHYTFKANDFSTGNENKIRQAMKTISARTCIKFKEHADGSAPDDHVEIIDGSGCWSYVGWQGGKQQLSLNSGYCMSIGTTTHEILHALGVDHEQARKDRDKYIKVIWANVESGQEINFQKEETDSLGVEYDPFSVMQYGNDDWSSNGGDTLEWLADPKLRLGGEELSEFDFLQLNLYYECDDLPVTTTTTKKPKTTTMKPTTTKTTTTKSTTTTMKPTRTKTTTTTTRGPKITTTTKKPVTGVCGDMKFRCVGAYYYPEDKCKKRFYITYCHQSCDICNNGDDEIQCGNFKDNENYDCKSKAMDGHCTSTVFKVRYRMKKNCTKTCCDEGHIYY